MTALFVPLMILNMVGGIIAGIWLAILGEWLVIGLGLAIAFLGNWIISIALMPGMLLFGAPGIALEKHGKRGGALFFAFLNSIYIAVLITIWCVGTLFLVTAISKTNSIIPLVLFAYGCSTAPWAVLAQKDQQAGGNEYSSISNLFAEIAFVVIGLITIIGSPTFGSIFIVFLGIMAIAVLIQTCLAISQSKKEGMYSERY